MRFLIKGGYLVDPLAGKNGLYDLLVERGVVKEVEPNMTVSDCPVLDVEGKYVIPGLVDMHVHLREPGFTHKETIASGAAAAVAGGFTSVSCMANTSPVIDNRETYDFVKSKAKDANLARVYPLPALTEKQQGKVIAPLEELAALGARGFSDDGHPVKNTLMTYNGLKRLSTMGLPLISHCEDPYLAAGGAGHLSNLLQARGIPGIPAAAESVMVARDILLAEETGGWVHIAHVSAASSVHLIAAARAKGIKVTAEVTPHHLFLNHEVVYPHKTETKVNPPLREEKDRQALTDALEKGIIDIIVTDHAPHASWEKDTDFSSAPFGMVGLETALPLLLTYASKKGNLSLESLVLCLAVRPAQFLNIKAGTLQAGYPADLVILDLVREGTVDQSWFSSKSSNSPFLGWKYKGAPCLTMVGGQIKMLEGIVSENIPLP